MKLRRGPDRILEVLRNLSSGRGQVLPRDGNLGVMTFEKLHPGHQRGDERREQDQEQKPGSDAQRPASREKHCKDVIVIFPLASR